MNHKHLCMIFGIVPGVCSKVIRAMLRLAVDRLSDNPIAEVRFPNAEKMRQFAEMVQSREPLVDDVIGFMDGVSIPAECTDERFEQNAFYCGYDCDTMVNNVFAYGPDGKVFFAAVNFPGSWADGALTARFLHTIKKKLVSTRSVWIRASHGAEKRMERLWAPSPKGLPDVFIEMSGSTFCESATCIRRFVRQASGGCVDCREPSPAGKSASQATTFSGG
jgi:hypothetical protein